MFSRPWFSQHLPREMIALLGCQLVFWLAKGIITLFSWNSVNIAPTVISSTSFKIVIYILFLTNMSLALGTLWTLYSIFNPVRVIDGGIYSQSTMCFPSFRWKDGTPFLSQDAETFPGEKPRKQNWLCERIVENKIMFWKNKCKAWWL